MNPIILAGDIAGLAFMVITIMGLVVHFFPLEEEKKPE